MGAQIVWLDGTGGVEPGEVGERAAALERLKAQGLLVPRTFVLGRSLFHEFTENARRQAAMHIPVKLPPEVQRDITAALRSLGGSFAIRRSPLEGPPDASAQRPQEPSWLTTTMGGRPERETYLHLTDAAEVAEAVRRIWGTGLLTAQAPQPVAICVQRFMVPDVCAAMRRDRADPDVLHTMTSLGIGDLLAAGLVVPDRHTLRRRDGSVLACSLGRKAQMTVPRQDGGVMRVPVPAHAARQMAVDDAKLKELHSTWRSAEDALPGLAALGLSWSGGKWYVTSAVSKKRIAEDEVMLG